MCDSITLQAIECVQSIDLCTTSTWAQSIKIEHIYVRHREILGQTEENVECLVEAERNVVIDFVPSYHALIFPGKSLL